MQQITHYVSPLGRITLAADEMGLIGVWFEDQKYYGSTLSETYEEGMSPVLEEGIRWLDQYFAGEKPSFTPKLHLIGTEFRVRVWQLLEKIPYGETATYGELAKEMWTCEEGSGQAQESSAASARAVGGAVGHNPISIIIPCHRVVGGNGALTGYAGGVERKRALLELEG